MSRNLEVLEQVQQDRELFRVPPVTTRLRSEGTAFAASAPAIKGDSLAHEQLVGLTQSLFLAGDANAEGHPRKVVFCGIDKADGASSICAQLSRMLAAQVSSQVCVVDANVRRPALYRILGLEQADGQNTVQAAVRPQLQQVDGNLWLIHSPLAASNGGVAASVDAVRSKIKDLPDEFAYVVINAPPVALYNDAVLLGQRADGVVLVLEANSTRRVAARKAKQALEAANVRVLGMVLNNRTFPIPESVYRLL